MWESVEGVGRCGRVWKGDGGCGRMWEGVERCGRVWKGVGGCGRMWESVKECGKLYECGRIKQLECSITNLPQGLSICGLVSKAPYNSQVASVQSV